MVFPLWRSTFSLNLMLSKEDRRALLLRLFNDDTPVRHPELRKAAGGDESVTTPTVGGEDEDQEPEIAYAEIVKDIPPPVGRTEDEYIKTEDIVRGEEQEDLMPKRETYQRDGDEEDRFNTTV
jgi:multisite-specific tRNA:(cytosine-C5)-methyltransferase